MVQEVNVLALRRSLEAVVGPDQTRVIEGVYQLIDRAMKDGYDLGFEDGQVDKDNQLDAAFDNGFDEGYLEGVADARVRPATADKNVREILFEQDQYAINGQFDLDLVRDSGDEDEPVKDEY
jgi:hypothetical protein